ncbi:SRPBCC domain-containing protein [Muricauda sp. CAU 1633]|uniref:SRPBCC family protein n=1 Tax=Allomuricauda sp. CAU 1633 TaxID=2816036 RepID=UPI001A8BF472|nr:SRPBCC domain-containing protein [Muricauda sp. CAU 1633]MBO0323427.1 SRPBCC domain-containing protein [Muricauda sp. CAU 1633]
MNTNLLFDFTVDKTNSTVIVKREFAAVNDVVWDAFTIPEILDQWWAPKPWVSKTKSMNFEVGGTRLYAMCGPNGEEHWALADFTSISPKTNFQFTDAFCDSDGNKNDEFPQSKWNLDFENQENSTLVNITITHESLEDLEKIIEMGFKEGFSMALSGLDTVLSNS